MKHLSEIKPVVSEGTKPTNSLISGMFKKTSEGRTENDALTYTRSGSALLDFFAQAGAMRANPDKALDLFKKAFSEDRQTAVRTLFYLRDVRGGQGERDLFRVCLQWLGQTYSDVFDSLVLHVPMYGRWDDILFDNDTCFALIKSQLKIDSKTDKPTLLAKWLPTINASSSTTRAKAKFVAKRLELSDIEYRKLIRGLRKKIETVEELMSSQNWEKIDYSGVPSQAARIYRNAFGKHDQKRYAEFIIKAETGEEKINAGTLYPYQLYTSVRSDYNATLNALWNQLPDYTDGKNALVVADVSASMNGDPMSVAVSLALYFAERNEGQFKNYFLTFSEQPTLQKVTGKTLLDKMNSIQSAHWGYNTDLVASFELILSTAIKNNTEATEMPSTVYIISDMEFDQSCPNFTTYDVIKAKYEAAGYEMPAIVFWNVRASGSNLPVTSDEKNVAMVSGFSPVAFKIAVENKTPEEIMRDTVDAKRYQAIVL